MPAAISIFPKPPGGGAVLSFELNKDNAVRHLLERVKLPLVAPSLGGVETILTHCWSMSHATIPAAVKEQMGLSQQLLRISAGIEDLEDLWYDLAQGLQEN